METQVSLSFTVWILLYFYVSQRGKKVLSWKQFLCKIIVARVKYIPNVTLFLMETVYCGNFALFRGYLCNFWQFHSFYLFFFPTTKILHDGNLLVFLGKINFGTDGVQYLRKSSLICFPNLYKQSLVQVQISNSRGMKSGPFLITLLNFNALVWWQLKVQMEWKVNLRDILNINWLFPVSFVVVSFGDKSCFAPNLV